MTIAITVVTPHGVFIGSDSRTIEVESGRENDHGDDFKVVRDNHPKFNLITDKIALVTSGYSRLGSWRLEDEIEDLKRMAQDRKRISELAEYFNSNVCRILTARQLEPKFGFTIAGYEQTPTYQQFPVMFNYSQGELRSRQGYAPEQGTFQSGMYCVGELDIIKKLLAEETVDYNKLSPLEVMGFIELMVTVGYKCMRYFDGYQEISGGPVQILVITPYLTSDSCNTGLDFKLNFKSNGDSECLYCGGSMRAVKEIRLAGEHWCYLTKCPGCQKSEFIGIVGRDGPRVMESENICRIDVD